MGHVHPGVDSSSTQRAGGGRHTGLLRSSFGQATLIGMGPTASPILGCGPDPSVHAPAHSRACQPEFAARLIPGGRVTAASRSRGDASDPAVAVAASPSAVERNWEHRAPCACLRLHVFNEDAFHYYEPLRRVRDHVVRHPGNPLRLEAAARIACLERSYSSTFFRRTVGITFSDWRGLMRVQQAACLLAGRDWSVDEVARQVGLSRRAFERRFKRHTEQTPRQFRDGHRPGAPPCLGRLPPGRSNPTI